MKRIYSTFKHRLRQLRKTKKVFRKLKVVKHKLGKSLRSIPPQKKAVISGESFVPIIAPPDLRLIESTANCLELFRKMRAEESQNRYKKKTFVVLSLQFVRQIDYGTISILTAISDDLKPKGVYFRIYFPQDLECKKFIFDSGYLNHLFDDKGRPFPKTPKSELLFFEKGSGKLSEHDNVRISNLIKAVVHHLTGISKHCVAIRTIILEICGNSIEWSGTEKKQWLLGVKYDKDKVVFTVTDVGKGILETLYRRLSMKFFDAFKSSDEILKGAFNQKYGSTTQESNRNKGLPAIKRHLENGVINELKVITNNVLLDFQNEHLSRSFAKGEARFRGTFYQWEMTKDCIIKQIIQKNE